MKSRYFICYLDNNILIPDLIVNAKNYKNPPSEFLGELFKARFHSLGGGIIAEVSGSSYGFNMNAECLIADPSQIINVAGMVQFRVALFKPYSREYFGKIIFDNRLFSDETVKSSVDRQVVYVVNAILQGKLFKRFRQ